MTDYFKYLLSPAILSLHAYGMWLGGNYAWIGLGALLGVLFLDAFLPRDYTMRDQRYVRIYDVICAVTVLASFGNVCFYAWLVGAGHFDTTSSALGAFVSMVFVGFVIGAPPVHELFHREEFILRWLGRVDLGHRQHLGAAIAGGHHRPHRGGDDDILGGDGLGRRVGHRACSCER